MPCVIENNGISSIAAEIALQRYDYTQKRNYSINRTVRIPVAILFFISLISSMPLLYDYRPLNTAHAASEGQTATFGPEINLSKDLPPLAVASDITYDSYALSSSDGENVYVAWEASGKLFFRASHDGGAKFDAPLDLSNESNCFGTLGMASSGNHVFVVCLGAPQNLSFRASHDKGTTFEPVIDLGSADYLYFPLSNTRQVVVSGSNVYLAWISGEGSSAGGQYLFAASHDNGVTFGPVISLMSFDGFVDGLELLKIVASGNRVYVAMQNFLRISDDNGVTFDPVFDFGPRMTDLVASDSNVYILSGRNLAVSHDGGSTFGAPINLGGAYYSGDFPDVGQLALSRDSGSNSNDNIYAVWHSINRTDHSESILFRTSHDGGETFDDVVTFPAGDDANVAVLGSDVYVKFRSFDSGHAQVLFAMSTDSGATFGPLTEVVDFDGYLNVPKLVESSSTNPDSEKVDNIFVAWQEANRGISDVNSDISVGDVFIRAARFIPLQHNLNLFEGTNPSDLTLDLGQEARAVVNTTDPSVSQVNFTWNNPSGDPVATELVSLSLTGQAESRFTPDEVGRWTVIVDFGNGVVRQQTFDVRLLVIPESPIGTLALIASSMAALAFYGIRGIHRRKQIST